MQVFELISVNLETEQNGHCTHFEKMTTTMWLGCIYMATQKTTENCYMKYQPTFVARH